ncbi:MAG: hypothetical protein IPJ56_02585 [Gemmatimonadetes bacterium]|nr:hypothetical protein [Gemmatimonadota bacterium]
MTTPADVIVSRWLAERHLPPSASIRHVHKAAEALIKARNPFAALDLLDSASKRHAADLRIEQLAALALANVGSYEAARQRLERARQSYPNSPASEQEETLALLGRVYKSLALGSRGREGESFARLSLKAYEQASTMKGGFYPFINAAAMAELCGDKRAALEFASKALTSAKRARRRARDLDSRYWLEATIGEATLLLGKEEDAQRAYAAAVALLGAGARHAKVTMVVATRRNARLIASVRGLSPRWIDETLRVPRVAICCGHMIDMPDRAVTRFPVEAEHVVLSELREWIRGQHVGIGYASAACGTDTLFHEALQDEGGESHVVLPFGREQFQLTSVFRTERDRWPQRFRKVLERASDVVEATEERFDDTLSLFEHANRLITGYAMLTALELEDSPLAVAVWNGERGDGPHGTADIIRAWQRCGIEPKVIRTDAIATSLKLPKRRGKRPPQLRRAPVASPSETELRTCAIIFGDIEGFSRLSDLQSFQVQRWYSSTVAAVLDSVATKPLVRESRGDGFYVVYESITEGGRQAIAISEAIASSTPPTFSEGKAPRLRLSLHAGPLFRLYDAILQRETWSGPSASLGARIEAVSLPSTVYCSREFAALYKEAGDGELSCEYVGRFTLPKNSGVKSLYRVRRATAKTLQ